MRIKVVFGKFQAVRAVDSPIVQANPFVCPVCRARVIAPDATWITCQECGEEGTKQQFSVVVRKAA